MLYLYNFACLVAGGGIEPPSDLFRIFDVTDRWLYQLSYPAMMGRSCSPPLLINDYGAVFPAVS